MFWSGGGIAYARDLSLSVARDSLGGASITNKYAIFAGGFDGYAYDAATYAVDAFNTSLTRSIPATLGTGFEYPVVGAGSDTHVIFADKKEKTMYAYNASLTRNSVTRDVAINRPACTSVGSYILFGASTIDQKGSSVSNTLLVAAPTAYNATLTKSTAPAFPLARTSVRASKVGSYALFASGYYGTPSSYLPTTTVSSTSRAVYAYNASLTLTTGIADAKAVYANGASANNNKYAAFMTQGSTAWSLYDSSLTLTSISGPSYTSLTLNNPSVAGLGDYLIMQPEGKDVYGIWDSSLTRIINVDKYEKYGEYVPIRQATAVIGSHALFAGGYSYTYEDDAEVIYVDTVRVYQA